MMQSTSGGGIRTEIFQAKLWNKEFPIPLALTIIHKIILKNHAVAHAVLLSTDLELPFDKLIEYHKLKFQFGFNFRDVKQYWMSGRFHERGSTPVTNAVSLSLSMVNLFHLSLDRYCSDDLVFSVLDLKAHYRGYRYMADMVKMLPQKPEGNLLAAIFM